MNILDELRHYLSLLDEESFPFSRLVQILVEIKREFDKTRNITPTNTRIGDYTVIFKEGSSSDKGKYAYLNGKNLIVVLYPRVLSLSQKKYISIYLSSILAVLKNEKQFLPYAIAVSVFFHPELEDVIRSVLDRKVDDFTDLAIDVMDTSPILGTVLLNLKKDKSLFNVLKQVLSLKSEVSRILLKYGLDPEFFEM
jgi:hypothetical protein